MANMFTCVLVLLIQVAYLISQPKQLAQLLRHQWLSLRFEKTEKRNKVSEMKWSVKLAKSRSGKRASCKGHRLLNPVIQLAHQNESSLYEVMEHTSTTPEFHAFICLHEYSLVWNLEKCRTSINEQAILHTHTHTYIYIHTYIHTYI
jgi:hypothetical protein